MKVIAEEINYKKIVKTFTIKVGDNAINVDKWVVNDNAFSDYEADWELWTDSKFVVDRLDQETQDKLVDFINDLSI